jgi:DNA-3-methyladenine glycosylase II
VAERPDRRSPEPGLEHLRGADPVLADVIDAHPGFVPRAWLAEFPPFDAFGALLFQVVGQQLSVAATRRILERIRANFGGRFPEAAELLRIDPLALRQAGLSQRKVDTLRAVAAAFADGTLSDAELRTLPDEEIESRLTAISGIGPWTVHGMLIIAFDRPDVVLPGDLALRKAIRHAYALDHLPTQDEVIAIAEAWRPYRSLATALLFQAAFDAPLPEGPSGSGGG